jgi:hypothetical protein
MSESNIGASIESGLRFSCVFLLVKANGYITGFDVLAGIARAMRSVSDIKKISRCFVRRLLFGAVFGARQLLVGRDH